MQQPIICDALHVHMMDFFCIITICMIISLFLSRPGDQGYKITRRGQGRIK